MSQEIPSNPVMPSNPQDPIQSNPPTPTLPDEPSDVSGLMTAMYPSPESPTPVEISPIPVKKEELEAAVAKFITRYLADEKEESIVAPQLEMADCHLQWYIQLTTAEGKYAPIKGAVVIPGAFAQETLPETLARLQEVLNALITQPTKTQYNSIASRHVQYAEPGEHRAGALAPKNSKSLTTTRST